MMDRKMIMGVAAVAGIGLLLYMRKNGDQATLAGSGSLVGAASSAANWASTPIVINATTKPAVVVDKTANNQPVVPPKKSDPNPGYVQPGPAYSGVQGAGAPVSVTGGAEPTSRWANFADGAIWGAKK